jgi:predicted GIY-YIG superfamily endonuclease
MAGQQLHLFSPPKPLEQRLGKAFFLSVPRSPGVYLMTGRGPRVLYIGQSKNLRVRLASYKNARLDRAPRRVVRLVHEVDSIVWERCATAQAAQEREAELLRLHRPRYNRVGTYPHPPVFLTLAVDPLGFALGRASVPAPGVEVFGPFVRGAVARHGSLVRLLWTALRQPESTASYPAGLLQWRIAPEQWIPWTPRTVPLAQDALLTALRGYLSGQSEDLIGLIAEFVPPATGRNLTQRELLLSDLEALGGWLAGPEGGPVSG